MRISTAAVVDQFTIAPDFLPTAIGHFLALGHQTGKMPPTLKPHEFIRRFLMHVLPKGFHRIRHVSLK